MGATHRRPMRLMVFVGTAAAATSLVSAFAAAPGANVEANPGEALALPIERPSSTQREPGRSDRRDAVLSLTPGSVALLALGGVLAAGPLHRGLFRGVGVASPAGA